MKVGFDIQPLQTEQSAKRGIGRFTQSTLTSLLNQGDFDDYVLFSNKLYKNPDFKLLSNVLPILYKEPKTKSDRTVNNIIQLLKYQNSQLDILQIFSPFEGYPSNRPVINPYFDKLNCNVCTVIHDFIPLHMSEHYLSDPSAMRSYYRQLKTIYNSDVLFAVSESTRDDAVNILKINPKNVITIGEGSDYFHKLENIDEKKLFKLKKRFGIKKQFLLYAGGIDFRKNIEKSIEAFSKINESLLTDTSYVIVCEIYDNDRKRLTSLAKNLGIDNNLVLTGYISDEELNLLYNSCTVFVFPSLHEGFGLPVLEAMTCGTPVIGSNTSAIAELIKNDDYMFNPDDAEEISSLMSKMLTDNNLRQAASSHSITKSSEYSWNKTANKILSVYKDLQKLPKKTILRKPRVAYFSPLPPKKSGISDYSAKLLPFLEKYWDIDIFVDDYECSDNYLKHNFSIRSHNEFEFIHTNKPYDVILYQIGNSDHHIYMFDYVKKFPGLLVLHDVYLSGVIYWITGKVGKIDEFIDEVVYSHGDYGLKLVNKAKKNVISWDKIIWELQINKRFIDSSKHVIVHSDWDKQQILSQNPSIDKKISLVHQPSSIRLTSNKQKAKKLLGFNEDDFLICSFGFVVPTKKLDSVIRNLKPFLEKNQNAKYVIVGDTSDPYGQSLHKLVDDLNLDDSVIFTGYIKQTKYQLYLDSCDISISLRTNARAGTSASINDSLGAGIPTILSEEGPFKEFDSNCVIKLKEENEKDLTSIIGDLYSNQTKLNSFSKLGQGLAINELSIDSCVNKYVNIVNQLVSATV